MFILKFILITSAMLCCLNEASARSSCQALFVSNHENWTQYLDLHRGHPLEDLREFSQGRWLEVQPEQWVHYEIYGKSGPLRIHFEGLGGQIETSLKNRFLKEFIKKGRVLVVELEGQGLREVHTRLALEAQGRGLTREISFDKNLEIMDLAIQQILTHENIPPALIHSWSGHSFGGLILAGLAQQEPMGGHSPLLQFVATGVANFNHRLISPHNNAKLEFYGQMMGWLVPKSDHLAIQSAIRRLQEDPLMSAFREDAVKMEAAIGLTLGAGRVDAVHFPENFPVGTRVQIFSAANDTVIFNMFHWELAEAARLAGHQAQLVFVDGVSHYLTQDLNRAQVKAKLKMTQNPGRFKADFYRLTRRGQIQPLSYDEALALFKASSYKTWELQKNSLYEIFSALGQTPRYPEDWQ